MTMSFVHILTLDHGGLSTVRLSFGRYQGFRTGDISEGKDKRMKPLSRFSANRFIFCVIVIFACMGITRSAIADPAWYAAGTGGFNPNIPDFYQHQDWTNGSNAWEPKGGWCEYTAYADVFYDLTTMNYTNLYTSGGQDPTPAGAMGWYTAMYGATNAAADVKKSDIYLLTTNMKATPFGSVQSYLNTTANKSAQVVAGTLPTLLSNNYPTGANGDAYYFNALGQPVDTGMGVATFTNYMLKDRSSEVLYNLNPGSATPRAPANANGQTQGLWWNFHYVAVAGISTAKNLDNSTIYVADPDSNLNPNTGDGSGPTAAGWPTGKNATNIGFPFVSAANAPLPDIASAVPRTNDFAGFTFNNKRVVASADAPQYKNTYVQSVATVYPGAFRKAQPRAVAKPTSAGPGLRPVPTTTDEETDITLVLPSSSDAVDGVYVEPSSPTDNPVTDPGVFSFSDDSDPSTTWTDSESTTDPFGNVLADDGIAYDLSSGAPLEPGETADLNIGTSSDFTASGYDILLHFEGDPSNVWLPEMIGGTNFDPTDDSSDQTVNVPEPMSIGLLAFGCLAAGGRRRTGRGNTGVC
jgi:hypothetical protein